jgi:hypothetical protein
MCVDKNCSGRGKVKCEDEEVSDCYQFLSLRPHTPGAACVGDNESIAVQELREKILQRAKNENTLNSIIFQEEINK